MNLHSGPAWLEGMRILPQHFQQQEIMLRNYLHNYLQLFPDELWGISNLRIDSKDLKNGQVRIKEVTGIFQDGTFFHYDETFHKDLVINSDQLKSGSIIYLGLSKQQSLINESNQQGRYILKSERVIDLTSSIINAEEVIVKQNAFVLFTEDSDMQGYLTIPIVKIKRIHSEMVIELDSQWIMPFIKSSVSSYLSSELKQILRLLKQQQHSVSEKVTQSNLNLTTGMHTNILLMTVLNRHVMNLEQKLCWTPRALYQLLYNLYAELSVFYTNNRLPEAIVRYDHSNPFCAFDNIFTKLRKFLMVQSHHQAIKIDFLLDDQGLWTAQHGDSSLFVHAAWYLTAHIDAAPDIWQMDIAKHIKIASPNAINDVIKLQLQGVPFEKIATVPPQLPYLNNTVYFRIDTENPKWKNIEEFQALKVHIDKDYGAIHLQLWAIPESIKEKLS